MHVSLARVTKDKYHDGQRRMYSCVWWHGRIERMLGCRAISVALLLQERVCSAPSKQPIGLAKGEAKEATWKPKTPLTNLATRPPVRRAENGGSTECSICSFPSLLSPSIKSIIIGSTSSPSIVVLVLPRENTLSCSVPRRVCLQRRATAILM
jgi:hypothetical protein